MCFNRKQNDPDLTERAFHESGHSIIGYRYHYIIVEINCSYGQSATSTNYLGDMIFAQSIQTDNYANLRGLPINQIERSAMRYSDYLMAGSYAWNFHQTNNVNHFQVNLMNSNEFNSDYQRLQRINVYVQRVAPQNVNFIGDSKDRVKAHLQNQNNWNAINELARQLIRKTNHSFSTAEFQAFVARQHL